MKTIPYLLIFSIATLFSRHQLKANELEVQVNAEQGIQMYAPVWIEKGELIHFEVSGQWTMWKDTWPKIDSNGHTFYKKVNGYHVGTLMGGVSGGKPFPLKNGYSYRSPISGFLILYPNRGRYSFLNPEGSLKVSIRGATTKDHKVSIREAQVIKKYNTIYGNTTIRDLEWTGDIDSCQAGDISTSARDKMKTRINYFREITGLYPVEFKAVYNTRAQAAALTILANKKRDHSIDSSWKCFSKEAALGSLRSNLGISPVDNLITEFIEDYGKNYTAGHRKMVLNSRYKYMGFGAAYNPEYYPFVADVNYVVEDTSVYRGKIPEYVAYPPSGYIVEPLFFPRFSFAITRGETDYTNTKIEMVDSWGDKIPLKQYEGRKGGIDTIIVWDIAGGFEAIDDFKVKHINKPIHVNIYNVIVNGKRRNFSYTVQILTI